MTNLQVALVVLVILFQIGGMILGLLSLLGVWKERHLADINTKFLWCCQLVSAPLAGAWGLKLIFALVGYPSPVDLTEFWLIVFFTVLPIPLAMEMLERVEITRRTLASQKSV